MSEEKTKKVTITLTNLQKQQAKDASFKLLGKENISGYIGHLISKDAKDGKK